MAKTKALAKDVEIIFPRTVLTEKHTQVKQNVESIYPALQLNEMSRPDHRKPLFSIVE